MVVDPVEHLGQPGTRIDVVEFGGDDERVHGYGTLTTTIGTGEQPRLATKGNTAQGSFSGIIRQTGPPIIEESAPCKGGSRGGRRSALGGRDLEIDRRAIGEGARSRPSVDDSLPRHCLSEGRMCPCTALGAASQDLAPEVASEVKGFFKMCLD